MSQWTTGFSVGYLYYLLELCDTCISAHLHLPEHPLSARSCGCALFEVTLLCISFSPLSCPANLRCITCPEHWSLFSESSAWTPLPCAVVWKAFLTREHMQMRSHHVCLPSSRIMVLCFLSCPMPIKSFPVHFTQLYSCAQWEAKTESKTVQVLVDIHIAFLSFLSISFSFLHSCLPSSLPPSFSFFSSFLLLPLRW